MKNVRLYIRFITVLTVAVLSFAACSDEASPPVSEVRAIDLVNAAAAVFPASEIPDSLIFYKDAENEENIIDLETAGVYFYDEYAADMTALSSLADYAIHMPNTFRVFEIDVFKAADENGVDAAAALLEARLLQKNNGDIPRYTPEEAPLLKTAEIYTVGSYAILVATPDNAAAKAAIAAMLNPGANTETDAEMETETAIETTTETVVETTVETTVETVAETTVETVAETVAETTVETAAESAIKTAVETEAASASDISEAPVVTVNSYTAPNQYFVGGTCAPDAEIHIRTASAEYVYLPDDDNFMGTVEWEGNEAVVEVTAKQPGKAESEPLRFNVKRRSDITYERDLSAYYFIAGNRYQYFIKGELADYEGTNTFSAGQLDAIGKKIKANVEYADSIGAEIVYLIIPVPMNVYPELVPERYTKNTSGVSRSSQFGDAAREAGATVIDLLELFTEHKNDEFKLFHKTDTHWTQYGGYLGYSAIIGHIAQSGRWQDVKLREIGTDVEFYKERVSSGDHPIHMDWDKDKLKENATFMRYLFDAPDVFDMYYEGTSRLNHGLLEDKRTVKNPDTSRTLPRAYVMRDSFGSCLYSLMNDTFSEVSWQAMWNYDFNKSSIGSFKPDYIIYVIAERNIDSAIN